MQPQYSQAEWKGAWNLSRFDNKATSVFCKFVRKVFLPEKSIFSDYMTLALASVNRNTIYKNSQLGKGKNAKYAWINCTIPPPSKRPTIECPPQACKNSEK